MTWDPSLAYLGVELFTPTGWRLSRFPHNAILNLGDFIGGQFEDGSAHIALYLLSVADTDDCACDSGVLQRPGYRHFAGTCFVALTNRAQYLDEPQTAREQWLLKIRVVFSPVVFRHGCDPLGGHSAGQQARSHRGIDDDANPLAESI